MVLKAPSLDVVGIVVGLGVEAKPQTTPTRSSVVASMAAGR